MKIYKILENVTGLQNIIVYNSVNDKTLFFNASNTEALDILSYMDMYNFEIDMVQNALYIELDVSEDNARRVDRLFVS